MKKQLAHRIVSAFTIVMMVLSMLPLPQVSAHPALPPVSPSFRNADIGVGTAWTNVYHNIALPGATAASFAVTAGSNRMLVVALSYESSGNGALTATGVTYGGAAMTAASANDTSSASMHSLLYYLPDNPAMDGTSKTLAVTITGGGTAVMQNIWYAVFTGVDQNRTPDSTGAEYREASIV